VRAWQWWELIKAGEKPILPSEIAETRRWLDGELEKLKCEAESCDTEPRSCAGTELETESADSPAAGWWPGSGT